MDTAVAATKKNGAKVGAKKEDGTGAMEVDEQKAHNGAAPAAALTQDQVKRYKSEDRSIVRIRDLLSMVLGCELRDEEVELDRVSKALSLDWPYLLRTLSIMEDLGVFRRTSEAAGQSCLGAVDTDLEIAFAIEKEHAQTITNPGRVTAFINECLKKSIRVGIEETGFSWLAIDAVPDASNDDAGLRWYRAPLQLTIDGFRRILENDMRQAKQSAILALRSVGERVPLRVQDTVGFIASAPTNSLSSSTTTPAAATSEGSSAPADVKKEGLGAASKHGVAGLTADVLVSIGTARGSDTLKTFEKGVAQLRLMESRLDDLLRKQRDVLGDLMNEDAQHLHVSPQQIAVSPIASPDGSTFVLTGSKATRISVPHPFDGVARGQLNERNASLLARYQVYAHDTAGELRAFLLAPPVHGAEAGDDGTTGLSDSEDVVMGSADASSDDGSFSLESRHQRQEKARKRRQRRLIRKLQWEGHVAAARACNFGPPSDRTGRFGGILGARAIAFAAHESLANQRKRERMALENLRTRAVKRVRPEDPELASFEPPRGGLLKLGPGNMPAKFVKSWRPDMRNFRRMGHLKGVVRYDPHDGIFKPVFGPADAEAMSLRRDVRPDVSEPERRRNAEDLNDEGDAGAVDDALGYLRVLEETDSGKRYIRFMDEKRKRLYYYDRIRGGVQWHVPAEATEAGDIADSDQLERYRAIISWQWPDPETQAQQDRLAEEEEEAPTVAAEDPGQQSLEDEPLSPLKADAAEALVQSQTPVGVQAPPHLSPAVAPAVAGATEAATGLTAPPQGAKQQVKPVKANKPKHPKQKKKPAVPQDQVAVAGSTQEATAAAAALAVATAADVAGHTATPLAQAAVMENVLSFIPGSASDQQQQQQQQLAALLASFDMSADDYERHRILQHHLPELRQALPPDQWKDFYQQHQDFRQIELLHQQYQQQQPALNHYQQQQQQQLYAQMMLAHQQQQQQQAVKGKAGAEAGTSMKRSLSQESSRSEPKAAKQRKTSEGKEKKPRKNSFGSIAASAVAPRPTKTYSGIGGGSNSNSSTNNSNSGGNSLEQQQRRNMMLQRQHEEQQLQQMQQNQMMILQSQMGQQHQQQGGPKNSGSNEGGAAAAVAAAAASMGQFNVSDGSLNMNESALYQLFQQQMQASPIDDGDRVPDEQIGKVSPFAIFCRNDDADPTNTDMGPHERSAIFQSLRYKWRELPEEQKSIYRMAAAMIVKQPPQSSDAELAELARHSGNLAGMNAMQLLLMQQQQQQQGSVSSSTSGGATHGKTDRPQGAGFGQLHQQPGQPGGLHVYQQQQQQQRAQQFPQQQQQQQQQQPQMSRQSHSSAKQTGRKGSTGGSQRSNSQQQQQQTSSAARAADPQDVSEQLRAFLNAQDVNADPVQRLQLLQLLEKEDKQRREEDQRRQSSPPRPQQHQQLQSHQHQHHAGMQQHQQQQQQQQQQGQKQQGQKQKQKQPKSKASQQGHLHGGQTRGKQDDKVSWQGLPGLDPSFLQANIGNRGADFNKTYLQQQQQLQQQRLEQDFRHVQQTQEIPDALRAHIRQLVQQNGLDADKLTEEVMRQLHLQQQLQQSQEHQQWQQQQQQQQQEQEQRQQQQQQQQQEEEEQRQASLLHGVPLGGNSASSFGMTGAGARSNSAGRAGGENTDKMPRITDIVPDFHSLPLQLQQQLERHLRESYAMPTVPQQSRPSNSYGGGNSFGGRSVSAGAGSSSGAGPGPSSNDQAVHFLNQVKTTFKDRPHVYDQFVNFMTQIKEGELKPEELIHRIHGLFYGHPELLESFQQIVSRMG